MLLAAGILFVVFSIFFCIFFVVYRRSANELTRSVVEESVQSLTLASQEVSESFLREWNLLTEDEFAGNVKQLFTQSDSGVTKSVDYAHLLTLRTQLSSRFRTGEIFHDVSILALTESGDFFCTSSYISDDFARDYENGLYRFSDLDYSEFRSMLAEATDHRYSRRELTSGYLAYDYDDGYAANAGFFVYRYTPANASAQIFGLLQVDLDGLQRMLSGSRYAGDYFMVAGKDGVIYTTDPAVALQPDGAGLYTDSVSKTIYLQTSIDKIGVICALSLDQDAIYASIANFGSMLRILSIVFVVLALLLTALFFLRWHYPVIRIAQRIVPGEGRRTAIDQIDNYIVSITEENLSIASRLRVLEPAARSELLNRFYTGSALADAEVALVAKDTEMPPDGAFRCIVVGCIDLSAPVRQTLERIYASMRSTSRPLMAATMVNGQFVALVGQSLQDCEDSHGFFADMNELLGRLNCAQPEKLPFAMGVSDIYMGYASVPMSYQEAQSGWADALTWQNPAVVFSSTEAARVKQYRLSYDQLEKMYHALNMGDAQTAVEIFDQAVNENFGSDGGLRLRRLFCQQFYYDLLGVFTRLSVNYDILPVIESLLSGRRQASLAKQLAQLRSALLECVELVPFKDGSRSLSAEIQMYCAEHFSDSGLSLSKVSEHFNLSESNLSKFFKAHTGVTFSNYVENLRIRQAEKLLLDGEMAVKSIAVRVGYQNTATFYNAFRRNHNCTPTQWLERYHSSRMRTDNAK